MAMELASKSRSHQVCEPFALNPGRLGTRSQWRAPTKTSGSKLLHESHPKVPKDSNTGVLGPKYYHLNGTWDQKPSCLRPWTLRVVLDANPSGP